ncbi:hypothetical protein [Rhizobium sp. Root651]|uniref:hypothetical protein n=1 Tax=Rhizobium sp. Root651 TaxID=1736577 RepID=UPI0007123ADA|nr:hypothetical protein [Rhizobium sp. Root651]KRA58166.1 hypothetical protein ASD85_16935 [Rhizobium sp. Root651]
MTKVVNSSEYRANAIFVGCSVNEDGEPLVEINGKAIGTVDGLLEFLGKYQGQQKAKVNVKWAAAVPPDGFLGPRDYKIASPHRSTAFWVDVPDGSKPRERIVMKAGKVVAVGDDDGRTNIEGADEDAVARFQRRLDEMESTFAKRVEEAIASAQRRNVRHHL